MRRPERIRTCECGAAELADVLDELERFAEDGCGNPVVSAADLDAVSEWLRNPQLNLAEELVESRQRVDHYGR